MKTIFKKITSFCLLALLLMTAVGSPKASAATSWGISLTQVATGVPYYSTYNMVNTTTASSGSTYNLTSNCAVVQFKYNSNIVDTWVWVDNINRTDYTLIDYKVNGGYCYNTVAIPNLKTGTHTIQVRAADPNYMSATIKTDAIKVIVPTATTTAAVTIN